MQKTITPCYNHKRRRITLNCTEHITDQSFKKQCDINAIMTQYQKTGMLPQQTTIPARYIDSSEIPTLEAAFEVTHKAYEAFQTLPPEVRRHMDNNPAQMEEFINNPKNLPILKEHGIIIETPYVKPDAKLQDVVDALKQTNKHTEKL